MIRQVFWLRIRCSFPFRQRRNSGLYCSRCFSSALLLPFGSPSAGSGWQQLSWWACRTIVEPFSKHLPYSYGDSTGLTPDFPFNLPHEAGEPNQCKCKMPVQIWSKSYQQRGLLIFSLVFRVKALIERNGWCGSSLQLPFRFGKPSTENRLPGLIEYSEKFNRTLSFFIHFFLKHFFNNSAIMESAFLRLTANICLCFFKVGD